MVTTAAAHATSLSVDGGSQCFAHVLRFLTLLSCRKLVHLVLEDWGPGRRPPVGTPPGPEEAGPPPPQLASSTPVVPVTSTRATRAT